MIHRLVLGTGFAIALFATAPLLAQTAANESASPAQEPLSPKPATAAAAMSSDNATAAPPEIKLSPLSEALRDNLSKLEAGNSDEERNEREAILAFYQSRSYAPLWLTPSGDISPKASLVLAEIRRAEEWGLDPKDFTLPKGLGTSEAEAATKMANAEAMARAEAGISLAVLKYGRYARGGRIINPAAQLSSYLDRRPQLLKPQAILDGIAADGAPDAYLRGLHPANPQFEKLRQKYLSLLSRKRQKSAEAKKLIVNMEEWRWMPADLGSLYVWDNIPDFTQRVVQNDKIIREVRIVAGQLDKQTPIFSRPLRKIVLKPTWIVPDSIKVRELWPDLLRGGSLMRQWALEVHAKDGQPLNWRKIDWQTADIREYEIIQPNGPKSVMGKVKFSFPNQHTVFMHDTLPRDKWMFNASRRTYSHGCMRVADPIGLVKIVLREEKGWDAAKVIETLNSGPLNNEIELSRKTQVHITYFTALVDGAGELHTFPDVYGHERRIALALEGKWDRIAKGRDHLAPVELEVSDAPRRRPAEDEASDLPGWRQRSAGASRGLLDNIFGDNSN